MSQSDDLIIKPKHQRGEDGYKIFSIRIKDSLVARIDEVSAKTERSRNELIGIFLEYALNRCVIEDPNNDPDGSI